MHTLSLTRCGSTNAVAAAWARAGGRLPLVVVADTQHAGRGQWGRRWRSPPGGLWFTVVAQGRGPGDRLPLLAAEAVAAGIHDALGPLPLEVVEPNDVLLGGAKVAGLLCERLAPAGGPVTLVGVGLNANAAPAGDDPRTGEPLRRQAASLAASTGGPVDAAHLLDACVDRVLASITLPSGAAPAPPTAAAGPAATPIDAAAPPA